MKPSIKTICKKNSLQDGLFPIYLRVTINRKSKFYSTPYKCKINEWDDKTGEFNSKFRNHLAFNSSLRSLKDKATDVLEKVQKDFGITTLIQFDNYFRNDENESKFFEEFTQKTMKQLEDNGQISYRNSIEGVLVSLRKFQKNIAKYRFEDIDCQFLTEYEGFLRKNGANDGGIANYMRNIRMIYNKAINAKIVSYKFYPFSDYKISKFKRKKIKKALSKLELDKIINFDISVLPSAKNARFIYLFSYYARGMNFTDLAELKWSELEENKFTYTRNKTKINIKVKLPDNKFIDELLSFYKMYRIYDTNYIFPILKKDKSEYTDDELNNRKDSVRRYFNKQLKKLLQLCGIEKNITFYTARHTFATAALRNGVNIHTIKQSLGHQSITTTENYLEDFSDNEVDKQLENIF